MRSLLLSAAVIGALANSKLTFKDAKGSVDITFSNGHLDIPQHCRQETCGAFRNEMNAMQTAISANTQALSDLTAALAKHRSVAATDTELDAVKAELQKAINAVSLLPGPKGERGERGERGLTGASGAAGAKGQKGDKGKTATLPPTPAPTSWELGMNIHPSDGHRLGWAAEWDEPGASVGSNAKAFSADYLSPSVWRKPTRYVAIVRHNGNRCEAARVWELTSTKSMLDWFENEQPGRHVASKGQHIFDDSAGLQNRDRDVIFATEGKLIFNWWYSNNGARIAVDNTYVHGGGSNLPGTDLNNDDLHGLGNEFGADTRNGGGSNHWWHDVSMHQGDCHGTSCAVQGTDHGTSLNDGPVYGQYSIFVSDTNMNSPTFACQGNYMNLKM